MVNGSVEEVGGEAVVWILGAWIGFVWNTGNSVYDYAICTVGSESDYGNAEIFSMKSAREKLFFGAAVAVILANFVGWGLYFNGYQRIGIIIGFLVALPPLYYILIGLWRKNYILVAVGGMFAVTHMTNV